MAITQSGYQENLADGRPGQDATAATCDVASYVVERNASASTDRSAYQIRFGRAVAQATESDECRPVFTTPTGTEFLLPNYVGVARKDITRDQRDDDRYPEGSVAGVMYRGDIFVLADGAVTVGADVTVNITTGELGATTASATHGRIPGARWLDAAADGGLARVRLAGLQGTA